MEKKTVFTREDYNKLSEELCNKCAKELGVPVDNMLGDVMDKLGISPEQLENMESEVDEMIDYLLRCGIICGWECDFFQNIGKIGL